MDLEAKGGAPTACGHPRRWLGLLSVSFLLAACDAGPGERPAPSAAPPPGNAAAGTIPACTADDTRERIAVWTPAVAADGALSSDPPQGDGRIVRIRLRDDTPEAACDASTLHAFTRPADPAQGYSGGLSVNLRGHATPDGGACRHDGDYRNEGVQGMHQGWIETYFGAVDEAALARSGRYCVDAAAQ